MIGRATRSGGRSVTRSTVQWSRQQSSSRNAIPRYRYNYIWIRKRAGCGGSRRIADGSRADRWPYIYKLGFEDNGSRTACGSRRIAGGSRASVRGSGRRRRTDRGASQADRGLNIRSHGIRRHAGRGGSRRIAFRRHAEHGRSADDSEFLRIAGGPRASVRGYARQRRTDRGGSRADRGPKYD